VGVVISQSLRLAIVYQPVGVRRGRLVALRPGSVAVRRFGSSPPQRLVLLGCWLRGIQGELFGLQRYWARVIATPWRRLVMKWRDA
jgi:hypothetical protein